MMLLLNIMINFRIGKNSYLYKIIKKNIFNIINIDKKIIIKIQLNIYLNLESNITNNIYIH